VVDSVTEGQRARVLPIEAELVGIVPPAWIAVGGEELQHHARPFGDDGLAELHVLVKGSQDREGRVVEPQQFFDGVGPQIGALADHRPLVGVSSQRDE